MLKSIVCDEYDVIAIIRGRKTTFRQVIKFPKSQAKNKCEPQHVLLPPKQANAKRLMVVSPDFKTLAVSPYKIGDILYVRETWSRIAQREIDNGVPDDGLILYKADDLQAERWERWQSPVIMPKEAARIYLRVTGVTAESLQDITPRGAWDEGCRIGSTIPWEDHISDLKKMCLDLIFKAKWNASHKENKWETNPIVWVVSFESTEKP